MDLFNFFKKKEMTGIINYDMIYPKKEILFNEISNKVLTKKQKELKPLLEELSRYAYLGGGTSIALQLGHRESIDFDFFTNKPIFSFRDFKDLVESKGFNISKEDIDNYKTGLNEKLDEIHVKINGVSFTLFNFYRTLYNDQKINIKGDNYILNGLRSVNLKDLGTMKLYAMMTRSKWKDAVDLYFILKNTKFTFNFLMKKGNLDFQNIFNEASVLENIIIGKWNKAEPVKYLIKNPPTDNEIIEYLKKQAIDYMESNKITH